MYRRDAAPAFLGYTLWLIRVNQSSGVWMRRTHLLCAICVSLSLAVTVGSQKAPPAVLSRELRARVQKETFGIVTSIRGLPLGVRAGLEKLFGSGGLDIAEPGAEFQSSDEIINPRLPNRRLVAAGCSYEYCLVYYERGGTPRVWRVALFHWTPEATRFEWGGAARGGLKTIDDVRRAILSGATQGPPEFW